MVVSAAVAGLGCSSPPSDVAVVGDSITAMVSDSLSSASQARWEIAATPGATTGQMRGAAAELASQPHELAIVNLGTNDALTGVPTATTTSELQAIVDGFSDVECIHLVTITTQLPASGTAAPEAAAAINEWIRRTAEERDDVHLIDWQAETAGTEGARLLRTDLVHPGDEGRVRLVEMLSEATC